LTGRGLGPCGGRKRCGLGRGLGRGAGYGQSAGFGRGAGFAQTDTPLSETDRQAALKERLAEINEEKKAIEQELED
jgi:hypothetical protein